MSGFLDSIGDAVGAGADTVSGWADDGAEMFDGAVNAAKSMSPSDVGHLVLDGAGMVPVVGEAADLVNGGWYALEGNWTDAALSAGAAIPFVGNAATAGKWAKRGADAVDAGTDAARALNRADDAVDTARAARRFGDVPQVGRADLDSFRAANNIPGDLNTIASARTNVPGLEDVTFNGASPQVRDAGGMPRAEAGPLESPNPNALFRNHAEEDIANQFVRAADERGLSAADLDGGTLQMHLSQRPCNICKQGLRNPNVQPGVLKQLSDRYPGLEIRITVEGGEGGMILKNGQIVE